MRDPREGSLGGDFSAVFPGDLGVEISRDESLWGANFFPNPNKRSFFADDSCWFVVGDQPCWMSDWVPESVGDPGLKPPNQRKIAGENRW